MAHLVRHAIDRVYGEALAEVDPDFAAEVLARRPFDGERRWRDGTSGDARDGIRDVHTVPRDIRAARRDRRQRLHEVASRIRNRIVEAVAGGVRRLRVLHQTHRHGRRTRTPGVGSAVSPAREAWRRAHTRGSVLARNAREAPQRLDDVA